MVRVNDRGPFAHGRIIDLSMAAADQLGMIGAGTARVRVEYLPAETNQYLADRGLELPEQWYAAQTAEPDATAVQEVAVRDLPTPVQELWDPAQQPRGGAQDDVISPPFRLSVAPSAQAAEAASGRYRILAGSFGDVANAEAQADLLNGIAMCAVKPATVNGRRMFRVLLGPVGEVDAARRLLEQAKASGVSDARILVE